jgi:translocation and assembly module TamB
MNPHPARLPREPHWLRHLAGALLALFALFVLLAGLTLESPWFERRVTTWVQDQASALAGTPVRIGRMQWSLFRRTVRWEDVTMRGTEAEDETPLLAVKSVSVRLSLQTLTGRFSRQLRLDEIRLEAPRIHVRVYPDGSTNLPASKGGPPLPEVLLDLAAGRVEVAGGTASIDDRVLPLEASAQDVALVVTGRSSPPQGSCDIRLNARELAARLKAIGSSTNLTAGLSASLTLFRDRAVLQQLRLQSGAFWLDGSGEVRDWRRPAAEVTGRFNAQAPWAAQLAGIPGIEAGRLEGKYQLRTNGGDWEVLTTLDAAGLSVRAAGEQVRNATLAADVRMSPAGVDVRSVRAGFWEGVLTGRARIQAGRADFAGTLDALRAPRTVSTAASGPVELALEGGTIRRLEADLDLKPLAGPLPVGGAIRAGYDAAARQLRIDTASLTLGGSRLSVSGSSASLQFELRTRNLESLLPPLRTLLPELPETPPVSLAGGQLVLAGRADRPLTQPRISGTLQADQMVRDRYRLHAIRAAFDLSPQELSVVRFSAREGQGRGRVVLQDWALTPDSALEGHVTLRELNVADLLRDTSGLVRETSGLAAEVTLSGTAASPRLEGRASVRQVSLFGQTADVVEGAFAFANGFLEVRRLEARRGKGRLEGNGTYRTAADAANAPEASATLSIQNWTWDTPVPVTASGRLTLAGRLRPERMEPSLLSGSLQLSTERFGRADVRLETSGGQLRAVVAASPFGARLEGEGSWKLDARGEGAATLRLTGLRPDAVDGSLPFTGLIEGSADLAGALADWRRLAARARFSQVRLVPKQQTFPAGITAADLTLRNDGDVVAVIDASGLALERLRMVAKDTELTTVGGLSFRNQVWNVLTRGQVNLAVLGTLRGDLTASGVSTINARLRGSLNNPQLDGRMQLSNASLQIRDIPNGLENVNGTVLFDRSRATVESATAESGGGRVSLSGFAGFSRELSYQLSARLDQVRVRYPPGVSTQVNAVLNLTGGSKRSLLSGTVTILRAALSVAPEAVALASRASNPALPEDNEFLKNQQFDIRVETAQAAQLATELSREVQADVDLRLRGTPVRPALLGRVSVTRGVISFFGTDYRINRGEVNFLNPARIEPQVDLDLETTVRGILVAINFAGPLEKMNMSYRSDPPLQAQEILALLAVGRTPASATGVGVGTLRRQDLLSGSGGNAVINSALAAAPTSTGGLQRFFGISRLKIDPQLIGIDNTPQARLSVEQQLSPVISLTYVTNLNRAQQQLVRVQWDLTRQWSAIATRDENGVLSVDFVFRRSFR